MTGRILVLAAARPPRVARALAAVAKEFPGAPITLALTRPAARRGFGPPPGDKVETLIIDADRFHPGALAAVLPPRLAAFAAVAIPVPHSHPLLYDCSNLLSCAAAVGAGRLLLCFADGRVEARPLPADLELEERRAEEHRRQRRREALSEVAEFTGETEETVAERVATASRDGERAWAAAAPGSAAAIEAFYAAHDFYLYEHIGENYFEGSRTNYLPDLAPHAQVGTRILDFGCGIAALSLLLADRGAAVTLVEISARLREFAAWRFRRHGHPVRVAPALAELPAGDRFDLVIATDVMEHLPAPVPVFRELVRLARPGGLLAFNIPFERRDIPLHLDVWRRDEYLAATAAAGLVAAPCGSDLDLWRKP